MFGRNKPSTSSGDGGQKAKGKGKGKKSKEDPNKSIELIGTISAADSDAMAARRSCPACGISTSTTVDGYNAEVWILDRTMLEDIGAQKVLKALFKNVHVRQYMDDHKMPIRKDIMKEDQILPDSFIRIVRFILTEKMEIKYHMRQSAFFQFLAAYKVRWFQDWLEVMATDVAEYVKDLEHPSVWQLCEYKVSHLFDCFFLFLL